MPQEHRTFILLPKAMDQASTDNPTLVGVRPFPIKIYVRRNNGYRLVQIVSIFYSPAWAKFQAAVFQSGIELQRYAGGEGKLEVGINVDDTEPILLTVENNSIDTDVRLTMITRGWQFGEV